MKKLGVLLFLVAGLMTMGCSEDTQEPYEALCESVSSCVDDVNSTAYTLVHEYGVSELPTIENISFTFPNYKLTFENKKQCLEEFSQYQHSVSPCEKELNDYYDCISNLKCDKMIEAFFTESNGICSNLLERAVNCIDGISQK
ncbi:MAG: hypothetical protein IJU23_02870 [Proteobacteria bacterium]|nr:hypothetical protein [Pseudomonadota bacterium]